MKHYFSDCGWRFLQDTDSQAVSNTDERAGNRHRVEGWCFCPGHERFTDTQSLNTETWLSQFNMKHSVCFLKEKVTNQVTETLIGRCYETNQSESRKDWRDVRMKQPMLQVQTHLGTRILFKCDKQGFSYFVLTKDLFKSPKDQTVIVLNEL